jgi:hypothetical protein
MKSNKAHIKKVHHGLQKKKNLKKKNDHFRVMLEKQQIAEAQTHEIKVNPGFWNSFFILIKNTLLKWKKKLKPLKLGL